MTIEVFTKAKDILNDPINSDKLRLAASVLPKQVREVVVWATGRELNKIYKTLRYRPRKKYATSSFENIDHTKNLFDLWKKYRSVNTLHAYIDQMKEHQERMISEYFNKEVREDGVWYVSKTPLLKDYKQTVI